MEADTIDTAPAADSGPANWNAVGPSTVVVRWLSVALFASIFLQRFAMPGSSGIALNLFVTVGVTAVLALRGALYVDPVRAALFLLFVCCASFSVVVNAANASVNSVLLAVLLYAPLTLGLYKPEGIFPSCISAFQRLMLFCAVAGIVQYLVQFVTPGRWLFEFSNLVPKSLLVPNFNTVIPLQWGSTIYKSNGVFFLEPSIYSQYLSLAVVFETLFFGATARLFLFGAALLFTYSGTGPMMLAVLLPGLMIKRRAYKVGVGLAAFVVLAVAFGRLWDIDAVLRRFGEFGADDSSATARFVAGAWLIADNMRWNAHDVVFGLGPGSFRQFEHMSAYGAHDAVWAKLLFEYGAIGFVAFWALLGRVMWYRPPSGWVAAALTVGFLTFGGMMLDPRLNTLILVFCALPKPMNVGAGRSQPAAHVACASGGGMTSPLAAGARDA